MIGDLYGLKPLANHKLNDNSHHPAGTHLTKHKSMLGS